MFLESEYKRVGAPRSSWGGAFPAMDNRGRKSADEENHQRAAVEFVMELAGKHTVPVNEKIVGCQSLLYADELPVPMFNVDFDMRCVLWNKRASDLTGWSESEVFAMPSFHDALFSSQASRPRDLVDDILKGALDGQSNSQEVWNLKTKWGQEIEVLVAASPRFVKGVVSGAICVIMPLGIPSAKQSNYKVDCNVKTMDEVSHSDLEDDQMSNDEGSPRSEDQFLAALEQPPSPYSDRGVSSMEMFAVRSSIFADQVRMQSEGEGTSVCSQDWCKSDQGSHTMTGGGGNALEASNLTRARAMVVDSRPLGRRSLTLMLERCGFEVSCACSGNEALWRYEQCLHDPEGFSVIFISSSLARSDDYDLILELRRMEQSDSGNNCLTTPALVVAVTDFDRWDLSNTEGLKQRDEEAGVDAVISCPSRVQQLRDTLTTLGVSIDHLDYANKSPRAAFNTWNNPVVLAR